MKVYVGIDGGGTKTKVCILDQNNHMLSCGVSGPSSIDTVTLNETKKAVETAYITALNQLDEPVIVQSVFAGLGGIRTPHDFDLVASLLSDIKPFRDAKITARNDTENALASGLLFDEGMTLIIGTGMICYGKDRFGNTHKSGGWGYKEGDAGSAYDLGFQAIKSLSRALDDRYTFTAFHQSLWDALSMTEPEDLISVLDRLSQDRTAMARLAPHVTNHANLGDTYASDIVDQATSEIARACQSVYNHLTLSEKVIVIIGSLGNAEGIFKTQLHEKIKSVCKDMTIMAPLVDPAHGAALLAKKYQ
jgi:N-acetylglucosamine kinase-like BadF-type ATPase